MLYVQTQKSADLELLIHQLRPSHCPIEQIKQQETYADMTIYYTHYKHSMDIVIPIGIHCYFGFVLLVESCEVSVSKTQSAINAINMSETYPNKGTRKTLFAGHILPPA